MRILPRNWKCLRLEEVCSFHRGLTYKKKDEVDFSQNAVLRANNVSLESGRLDLTEIRYIDDQIRIPPEKKVRKGSLLVCMASGSKKHLGKVALIDEDYGYAFGGFMGLLLPNAIVYPKYLYWITQSKDYSDYIIGLSDGANINNLKFSQLGKYQVPLPPLPEQKRIVAILDEAFAGIDTAVANTEKNLANARELFESYLNSVFSRRAQRWDQLTLKDVCNDYGRGKSKHRPRNDPKLYGGAYPFIQTGDVRNADHLIKDCSKTYNDIGLKQSKLWPEGTICITIAANIAETGILEFDACFPDSIIGLVVNEERASSAYVEFLLQSVKSVLKAKGKGSAQDNINLGTLENERFPFPDMATQIHIVENVQELRSSIRSLESNYQHKLVALGELKQSLLQKAFSGELTAGKAASDAIRKAEEVA